jgi:hydroxymethylpyrimidine pyrophosphatase-like HAD family hydrolase
MIRLSNNNQPFLLAADIDGTLLGDEEGEAQMMAFAARYSADFHFAFVTGRALFSVEELIAEGRLPRPDFICSSVGTELLDCHDPDNKLGLKYAARVSAEWDADKIYALGAGVGVTKQAFYEAQPRFRAGFDWDGRYDTLEALRERLAGQTNCRVLASYGAYIDVFPAHVGKGEAVRFLQRELNLNRKQVMVAGDSGNDREMFETDFQAVLPANALPELAIMANEPWHYHSELPAARGTMDGLRHFGFVEMV